MAITTDFNGQPLLVEDYGASNMAGFGGENYLNWTAEKYLDYVKNYNPKKTEVNINRHKQKMGQYGKSRE